MTLHPGETITRGAYLPAGTYTLTAEGEGAASVEILTQTEEDAIMNTKNLAYTGDLYRASFTAPEGNRSVTFRITAQEEVRITALRYSGGAEGSVKLNSVTPFSLVAQISPPCAPTMVFAM